MASTTQPRDDSSRPAAQAESSTEMDRALVHHYIRLHGRAPTPEERQSGAVAIPSARRPQDYRVPPLRRTLARLISRL